MTARQEVFEQLKREYTNIVRVQKMAYAIWEDEGRLDGEEVLKTPLGTMKRKDYHWLHAQSILEHFADVDAERMSRG